MCLNPAVFVTFHGEDSRAVKSFAFSDRRIVFLVKVASVCKLNPLQAFKYKFIRCEKNVIGPCSDL